MTARAIRLTQITLAAFDVHEMVHFYSAVFDCDFQEFEAFGAKLYKGSLADFDLLICPNRIAGIQAEQNRHQLKFSVRNIVRTMEFALEAGGTVLNEITEDHQGFRIAAVRDPDGNTLEFEQAPRRRKQ